MFDLDFWREVFQSIDKNRTRSLLSGFTVAFAILLFTVLFGLANGLNNTFNSAITKLVLGKHGYHDKMEQDITSSDESMKPTVIQLVSKNESSS